MGSTWHASTMVLCWFLDGLRRQRGVAVGVPRRCEMFISQACKLWKHECKVVGAGVDLAACRSHRSSEVQDVLLQPLVFQLGGGRVSLVPVYRPTSSFSCATLSCMSICSLTPSLREATCCPPRSSERLSVGALLEMSVCRLRNKRMRMMQSTNGRLSEPCPLESCWTNIVEWEDHRWLSATHKFYSVVVLVRGTACMQIMDDTDVDVADEFTGDSVRE